MRENICGPVVIEEDFVGELEAQAAAFIASFRRVCEVAQRLKWSEEQMGVWADLYKVVVDNQAGLQLLAELEILREENQELRDRLAKQ